VNRGQIAGFGAVAFGALTFAGLMLENAPGGTFNASDVARYVESGHRPAVFVANYLVLLGLVGLALLLTWLRGALPEGSRSSLFSTLSVAGMGAWIAGWGVGAAVPMVMGYGGGDVRVSPTVTYLLATGGWAVMAGGAALIGFALLTLTVAPSTLPAWVRWSTLVAAVAAVAAYAWFPFFLFYLWSVVIGLWLLVSQRGRAPQPIPATEF
jgi:hypothetical protein